MDSSSPVPSLPCPPPPSGPFTTAELHLPFVDRWTPLRLLLYPLTAAVVWLVLLPCACLVHLVIRTVSYLSSLHPSTPPPPLPPPDLASPPSPTSFSPSPPTLSLPPTLPLKPLDGVWLYSSPHHENVITAVLLLSSPLSLPLLLHRISTSILPHPGMERLRYLPSPTLSLWLRDDAFHLPHHVFVWPYWKHCDASIGPEPTSPLPTDDWGEEQCEAALLQLVSAVINTPVQSGDGRPSTWSFALLPRYGAGCVVVFRAHHSLADGVLLSGVLLERLMDPVEGQQGETAVETEGAGEGGEKERLTAVAAPQWTLGELLGRVRTAVVYAGWVGWVLLLGPLQVLQLSMADDDSNPLHTADGLTSPHKSVGWSHRPISLHRVKRISRYYQSTVNDVMMTVLVAALQRVVEIRGMAPGAHSPWPQRHMHFIVPINIRPLLSPFTGGSRGGEGAALPALALGNVFSVVVLPFPLYAESPRSRLLAMARQMTALKRSAVPLMMFIALYLAVALLPPWVAHGFIHRYSELCTAVITNNRSPGYGLRLGGAGLRSWVSWAPCGGSMGVSLTIMTYAGWMRVSAVVDEATGVEGEEVIRWYEEEMEKLEATIPTHFM